MNRDSNQSESRKPYNLDLSVSQPSPLTASSASVLSSGLTTGIRPPNPASYASQRRFTPQTPALLSHPDDNPGPWTRRSASWSRAEDERLAQLVQIEEASAPTTTPTKMWSRVASQLSGRTGKQCRERWLNQLKPGIRRGQWTDEEELILHTAHAELGNKWVAIAQRLPGRTDNCVKNHWNSMLRKRQRREAALRSAEMAARSRIGPSRPSNVPLQTNTGTTEVNSDLARRASAMADSRSLPQMPSSNFYDMVHAANPGTFDGVQRGIAETSQSLSPITPQRNSKIQIANLVQSHRSKSGMEFASDPLGASFGVNGSFFPNEQRNGHLYTPADGITSKTHSILQPPLQLPTPGVIYSDPTSYSVSADPPLVNMSTGLMSTFVRKEEAHPVYGTVPFVTTISPVTTPVAGMGPGYPTLDQRIWSNPFGIGEQRNQSRANTGECSELTTSAERFGDKLLEERTKRFNGRSVSKKLGTVKSIDKTPVRRGVSGTSLAALAQVASSVPPSPLTPESRFSSTSRSASPPPSNKEFQSSAHDEATIGLEVISGGHCGVGFGASRKSSSDRVTEKRYEDKLANDITETDEVDEKK